VVAGDLFITGDAETDTLLNGDGTALLIGMLLDQQVPMEWAFMGPRTLRERLGHLDARRIAALDEDEFVAVCCAKPAIHRFPAVMGRRIHAMCCVLTDRYEGRTERLWHDAATGTELYDRLRELPGFGEEKAQIFVALLAKQLGVRPDGWEQAAGAYAEEGYRSVADVTDPASLQKVRDFKKAKKAEAKLNAV
jgi:uncharacterized HhH-GPD family protein